MQSVTLLHPLATLRACVIAIRHRCTGLLTAIGAIARPAKSNKAGTRRFLRNFGVFVALCLGQNAAYSGGVPDGLAEVLYDNRLASESDVQHWIMEGPGKLEFDEGWMRMYSPDMEMHHVLWCPEIFPDSFVAEWEVQNLRPASGLLIVFFAAAGREGKDLFDESLGSRDGTFTQYTKGALQSYHVSYYANSLNRPNRGTLHLRKNPGFHLVAESKSPIAADSVAIHQVRLEKSGSIIKFFIDGQQVLAWNDPGVRLGPVLGAGRIGFRQMRSSDFRYRNFRVYSNRR